MQVARLPTDSRAFAAVTRGRRTANLRDTIMFPYRPGSVFDFDQTILPLAAILATVHVWKIPLCQFEPLVGPQEG